MTEHAPSALTRRAFLAAGSGLVVSFAMLPPAFAQEGGSAPAPWEPKLPGSLSNDPFLDSWIRIDPQGGITVHTGKAELGQGIKTAVLQVAAEELEVDPHDLALVTADTSRTPNEGYTAGSMSMPNSATAIRNAAAQVRILLITEASRRLGIQPGALRAESRRVIAPDGRSLGYGELAASLDLHVEAVPDAPLKRPESFRVMGRPVPRVDIPPKVTGGVAYVHDLRLDGMVHARVVRPPSPAARLLTAETAAVEAMPGVLGTVRDGNFLAVVAEREFQAVKAMRALADAARWEEPATLPDMTDMPAVLRSLEHEVGTVAESGSPQLPADARRIKATFTRPYQIHGSIGPSCAIGLTDGDDLTVWSHTQGVYPDRQAIAEMLRMPVERVRVIHAEGSGCYGHNGADDAAADAALIARAFPGRPVRLQWMREQEHAWEPYGPAMVMEVEAALGPDGRLSHWNYDVWSNTHTTRPGPAGALLPARHIADGFPPELPQLSITRSGSGDRNAVPLYTIPNKRILWHFVREMPLRVSALRSLGAYANIFALESTMDEMAIAAGADPVEFRLRHLDDPRARTVVETAAARFGWPGEALPQGRGRGFAFARYKNYAAYFAVALELELDRESGNIRVQRAVSAIDSGEIVNPDGIRNQTEGGIIQSMSWTLYEQAVFDSRRVTSIDWASYPVLRFASVPSTVEVHVIDRPGEPFLGTGEAAQGPTAAAIGNAIRDAAGVRLHDLPFTRDRVRAAVGV
ncbi:molybdopterin cofactor-binding domain-containing protein [Azospirillum sp. SYSU D00513]|uniref:xanthine dehydrogenase family protein molybdopterin-binding subunit n=1 Tax=Azospirillum sp. SYSU D00513 TaxID=2812561 RepID=UPI001A95D7E5|nr:molybdopterin cofactor-binding domain-containing protein [Azospirillum sp. SYSU D00513]